MIISMVVSFLSSRTALFDVMRRCKKRYRSFSDRQAKPELAARTDPALHPDLAALRLNQLFGDCQA
jgi:hypothetical protein